MDGKNELRERFGFDQSEKMVMATVGGSEFGNKLLKLLYQAAPDLDCDRMILVTGPQIKLDLESSPRIICKRFLGDIMEWMKLSDFLVSLAGHTTSMEIASLGIPSLMVPIENHPEQMKNAMKMKNYGIAQVENMGTLTPEILSENINRLLESQDLRKNAEKTRNIFSKYNGTEDAVNIIRSCAGTGDEASH